MAVKYRRNSNTRKVCNRHKHKMGKRSKIHNSRRHSSSKRSHSRSHRRHDHHRGGNYEKDITTRETEGVATKPLHKFTVAVPGHSVMSGRAYKEMMERIDRDGPDI